MRKSKLMADRYFKSESIRVMQNVRDEREGHAAGGPEEGQEPEIQDQENAEGQPNERRQDDGNAFFFLQKLDFCKNVLS